MFRFYFNKINIFFGAFIAIITPCSTPVAAQNLAVVKESKHYQQTLTRDSLQQMIELKSVIPQLRYDLRYASFNNFMHRKLYRQNKITYLRIAVVKALKEVQDELNKKGYALKIFDAYRPYSITKKMWDLVMMNAMLQRHQKVQATTADSLLTLLLSMQKQEVNWIWGRALIILPTRRITALHNYQNLLLKTACY